MQFERDENGSLFTPENNIKLKRFVIYDFEGKQVTCKKRCEICKHCEIKEDDTLFCTGFKKVVSDEIGEKYNCLFFDISDQMINDIYHGLIK
jgi:hypothetical protein